MILRCLLVFVGFSVDWDKAKLSALKKELRGKEKDYDDLKACHVKFEREKKNQACEREELKVQVTRVTEEYQTVLARKENDFYV